MIRAPHLLLVPVLLIAVASSASARTWLVRPDGTGEAATILAAIDSVSSNDVIELADGVYTGEGNWDLHNYEKYFVIRSASGDPTACVIDCGGSTSEEHTGIVFWGGG